MTTIIAGSRSIRDYTIVTDILAHTMRWHGLRITAVYSGGAPGTDRLGERWAKENGIEIVRFIPVWYDRGQYNRLAGLARNVDMVQQAARQPGGGALVAAWDGQSRGTFHTIRLAREYGLRTYAYLVNPQTGTWGTLPTPEQP